MTAATLVANLETSDPAKEVVLLTVTDGYTYTSKKFGTVICGQATLNEDTTTLSIPIGLAISGGIVTIHCTGLSAKKVCLTLYGRK